MNLVEAVRAGFDGQVELYPRREGLWQLILPIYHEDGDMVDVFVSRSDADNRLIRIRDNGLTLMRLSYTFDVNTPTRERILDTLLANNGITLEEGEFFLDSKPEMIFQNVMQFIGFVQKVCSMRLWQRETIRSLFYEELESFVFEALSRFRPKKNVTPLKDYPVLEVDYLLETPRNKPFFLYGVGNQDKAKTAAIALLEFQKARLPFVGVVVHENIEDLPRKAATYLTRNADKQFPTLDDFRKTGVQSLERLAA